MGRLAWHSRSRRCKYVTYCITLAGQPMKESRPYCPETADLGQQGWHTAYNDRSCPLSRQVGVMRCTYQSQHHFLNAGPMIGMCKRDESSGGGCTKCQVSIKMHSCRRWAQCYLPATKAHRFHRTSRKLSGLSLGGEAKGDGLEISARPARSVLIPHGYHLAVLRYDGDYPMTRS